MSHDDRPCPPPESAPPVKKEDPRQRATVSFLGLLHYRLPPTTILSPYSSTKKMKKEILSLSPDARTENFRSDIRFLSRIDRSIDSRRFQFLLLTLRRDDEVTQSGGAAVVAIARDLLSKQRPNIAGTRRLNESQRTRGILVEINIIATDVTGCISRRGGARVDIDTGNTPVYWVSGSKVG